MKIKSKLILAVLSIIALGVAVFGSTSVFADTRSADAVVNVVPACGFSAEDATTSFSVTIGVIGNTEGISTKPDIESVCNGLNGWKIQAVGYSPDSTNPTGGVDGNTSMYSPVAGGTGNFIPTGTTGPNSYWSFKISSASSSTTATVLGSYGSYSDIPATPTNVVNYTGDGAGGTITGVMRADYQIYASGGQAPGTYTGKVKYTLVVNP